MGNIALNNRVLQASDISSRGSKSEHRLAKTSTPLKRRCRSMSWNAPGPENLCLDLSGQRKHRRAVDLGIPHAGQKIRGAGPGDRQAGCGASGELAIGRRRKGCGALMAHADIADSPSRCASADRISQPEVGVPDHAEHALDAPVDHGLCHHIGDGAAWSARAPGR